MADVKDEVVELEELLLGLESEGAVEPYSEDEDAVTLSMAAPIGDQEWMVQLSPSSRKMMSTDRVVAELSSGELSDTTLVWRGGMDEWMPIAQVDALTRARSSVPPPRPVLPPAPALVPGIARVANGADHTSADDILVDADDGAADDDDADDGAADDGAEMEMENGATPLMPPPPESSAAPTRPSAPRSYTGRPVAVDFSTLPPKRPYSARTLLAAGSVALSTVLVTLYSLSQGGVFDTAAPGAEARAVKSLEPAPAASAPASTTPTPAAEPPAEAATAAAPSSEEPTTEATAPLTPSARARAKQRKRTRAVTKDSTAGGSSAEVAPGALASSEAASASAEPSAARAKPAASRSKTRSVTPKPISDDEAEAGGEVAPPVGPTVGFNRQAAHAALKSAAEQAANCKPAGGPTGNGKVQVRYDATGKVGAVSFLTPGFDNTTTGSCIQMVFRRAKVQSFTGAPVTMTEAFEIR